MLTIILRMLIVMSVWLLSLPLVAQERLEERWPLEIHTLPAVEIKNVFLDKDENDQLYIAGRVKRKSGPANTGGYIALSISAAGRTYYNSISGYIRKNTYHHDRHRGRYFRIDLPKEPSENAIVRLIYFKRESYEQ